MPIKNRFADLLPEITEWRHTLHTHPELSFDEHKTAAFVAERLRGFGLDEVVTGIGRTGVVGVLKGRSTGSGRTIGLRADMDALPILEQTGLPYASAIPGRMHACGHDGHTSMLLGTAQYLAETRNFDGTVVFIFQPAEEGGGGAQVMCQDGLMDRFHIDEVYGLHNAPGTPIGAFGIRPGAMLASSDDFEIVVTGKGGHAAEPHEAIDTTLVGAHIVVALQSVVARNISAIKRVVLTVGTFETDSSASNIIAHTVRMRGTVRTLDEDQRAGAEARVKRIAEDTASAFGAVAEVIWMPGYPVTVNSVAETAHAAAAARAVSGMVHDSIDPIMPSEDFSYMLQERPGAFIFMGNGDSAVCHHPKYNFNDDAIPYGCSYFAELIAQRLPAA